MNQGGIYVVSIYSPNNNTIKIGRSNNIEKRIQSYKGYQYDGLIPKILYKYKTNEHKYIEKIIHLFAVKKGLIRKGKTEIFECNNICQFVVKLDRFIRDNFSLPQMILRSQTTNKNILNKILSKSKRNNRITKSS